MQELDNFLRMVVRKVDALDPPISDGKAFVPRGRVSEKERIKR
jgi:hypothetical protein